MFILKTFDKTEFTITDSEAAAISQAINDGHQKMITLQGSMIALSSISGVIPEDKAKESAYKGLSTDHKNGILHDGSRVVRQNGRWFSATGATNASGFSTVKIGYQAYPEILKYVPSEEDFLMYFKDFTDQERLFLFQREMTDITYYLETDTPFTKLAIPNSEKTLVKK